MNYQKLDINAKKAWRLGRLIRLIVISVVIIPLWIFIGFFTDAPLGFTVAIGVFVLLIFAYLVISMLLYPEIEYRQWAYLMAEDRVEIREGIFFIQTSIIPIIRMQHCTFSQGPISRKYGLADVTINTVSEEFIIRGLSHETAEQITEQLKTRLIRRMTRDGKEE
ncbi:MAG: hypothetical protein BGN88_06275 [Clostridiales bacterium 43-6]|nr:MAG: hypothetical protein BGN88_06275 [Clostridiales bacterium 43-6]